MVQQLFRGTEVRLDIAIGHLRRKPATGNERVVQWPVERCSP
jgi:hypothetical protein